MNRRDFRTAANLFLRGEHFRYVGSDEHEWWKGTDPVDAYEQHQSELPEYHIEVEEVEAYEAGAVGWAAVKTLTTFENFEDEPRPLRWTFVLAVEGGIWRIVQAHDSIAVPNPEVFGVEMTKSLEDLLASMGRGVEDEIRSTVRQGTVTLLFTDIEGSTELAMGMGDEAWAGLVEWHNGAIGDVVDGVGGTVVKTLGDGTMAAFESVREAARAAGAIRRRLAERTEDPPLRVRIGLHVGDTVLAEGDYLGTAVNKAARIAAAAKGGQIMASSSVRALLADNPEFSFGETHSVELKGIGGIHEISELIPAGGN
jgi:adenylate cyclase